MPQWQTNTPMRGSSPDISLSGGYSFKVESVPLAEEIKLPAFAAAPLACATLSGISFGEENAPQTDMPGLDVSTGEKIFVWQNLYLLMFIPSTSASFSVFLGGCIPMDKTIMLNSSVLGSPFFT